MERANVRRTVVTGAKKAMEGARVRKRQIWSKLFMISFLAKKGEFGVDIFLKLGRSYQQTSRWAHRGPT